MAFQDEAAPSAELDSMPAEPESDVYVMPATPGQTRFWWLHQMNHGNHALNIPLAWVCKGKLDRALVTAALAELVRRHESLRTTFAIVDGELSQVIQQPFEIPLPMEDLSRLDPEERRSRTNELIVEEGVVPMDMEKGPLFYARLIRLEPEEHILLTTIHHAVCDGWSNGILLRDFAAIYDSLARGVPSRLPELPIQFGDYAVWLDEWRKSGSPAASLEYWRNTLGEGLVPLRLQRDFPEGKPEKHGEIETVLIDPKLVEKAREFCATREVTLYMVLFSAYAVTLARLTGQTDFLIGTPAANRRPGTEDLIGAFSNPQILRVKLHEGHTLGAILDQVQAWTLGAVAHQDLPFESLYEDEFFARQEHHLPLQVYFIYQKAFMQAQHYPSMDIAPLRSVSPGTLFDLMLSIVERTEGPRLQLEYNAGYYRLSTIHRILDLYVHALEDLLSNLGGKVLEHVAASALENVAAADAGSVAEKGIERIPAKPETAAPVPPRDSLEAQLLSIWEDTFRVRGIGIHTNFFHMGGYSMMVVRLFSRINKALGTQLPITTIFDAPTIAQLADIVRGHSTYTSLVNIQPKGTKKPFFLIHSYLLYEGLRVALGEEQPFYGLRELDREGEMTVEQRALHYVEEIRKVQPQGPYQIGGWCAAGPLAVETARQLTLLKEEVQVVILFDAWRPGYSDELAKTQQKHSVGARVSKLKKTQTKRMSGMSTTAMVRHIWARMCNKVSREMNRFALRNRALMERVFKNLGLPLPDFMHNVSLKTMNAIRSHQGQPFAGRILLIRAIDTPRYEEEDPALGWDSLALQGTEVAWAPGDHESMFRDPNLQVVGGLLRRHLV